MKPINEDKLIDTSRYGMSAMAPMKLITIPTAIQMTASSLRKRPTHMKTKMRLLLAF